MASNRDLERAIRKRQAWLRAIDGQANGNGAQMWALMDEYSKRIIQAVGVGTNGAGVALGPGQLEGLLTTLDAELNALANGASALYTQAFDELQASVAESTLSAYVEFGTTTAERLQGAAESFSQRRLPGLFQAGHDQWMADAKRISEPLVDTMRRTLIRGELEGASQRQMGQWLLQESLFQFENLPNPATAEKLYTAGGRLGRNQALEHRANFIVRENIADTSNRMHERWTQEAGFELYINYNPLDSRTTDICEAASAHTAQTLEQWDATLGRPRRHMGCRSHLMAVPNELRGRNGLVGSGQTSVALPSAA